MTDFTVGIEEEFFISHARSFAPATRIPKDLARAFLRIKHGKVTTEMLQAQIEVNTGVCSNFDQAREKLEAACPRGIDAYFENVGGEILDTASATSKVRELADAYGFRIDPDAPVETLSVGEHVRMIGARTRNAPLVVERERVNF